MSERERERKREIERGSTDEREDERERKGERGRREDRKIKYMLFLSRITATCGLTSRHRMEEIQARVLLQRSSLHRTSVQRYAASSTTSI